MGKMLVRRSLFIAVLCAVAILSGCAWIVGPFNHMTIDGTRYALDKLYLIDVGEYEGVYAYELYLVTDGVELLSTREAEGTGEALVLYLAPATRTIENGTYRYDTPPDLEAFSVFDAVALVEYDFEDGSFREYYRGVDGVVNLRNIVGGGFVLDFELDAVDENFEGSFSVNGRFRGLVEAIYAY